MRISVVIATYNRLPLLTGLLEDLAAQQQPGPFDVTVVDDGSRESVAQALQGRSWPFALNMITQVNSGQAQARHRAILDSKGEIIVILDDDMQLPADFLAQHRRLHDAGADVVLGLLKPADDLAAKPIFERFHAEQLARFVAGVRAGEPISGSALCTGNVSLRRAHYLEIGGFDLTLSRSEDRDLGIRLQKAGARFAFSEQAYTKHRSDHTDRAKWKQRAFQYGIYDRRIAQKHPDDPQYNPWHYLSLVNPVSRPLLLGAVLFSGLGTGLAEAALRASEQLDRWGLERPALQGTTLTFGLEYFCGVRSEYPSALSALTDLTRYLGARRHTGLQQLHRL
jgi:GT2 family glycosyltransferase